MTGNDAIAAATLITVRECAGGPPQLLMVERSAGMAFAAGALVFPGGRIDPSDGPAGEPRSGKVAAIRETVEETAIPSAISPVPTEAQALELQSKLLADRPFAALLDGFGLDLDLDSVIPFARWVPKFHATRRFDTTFFVTRAPDCGWEPNVVEGECTGALWISAKDALDRDRDGSARLIFPTRRNLERLAQHDSFDAIRADAAAHAIVPISPWVEEMDGENFITIPDGIGYPVTKEKLDGLWRG